MNTRFETPESQAWLRLWVSLFGPGSRLCSYLKEPDVADVNWREPVRKRRSSLDDQAGKQARRNPRPPSLETPKARLLHPAIRPRTARRIDRDIDRVTRLPTSDWAKRIIGDPRIAKITLQDILDGVETYFDIFKEMRKVNKSAYDYFSRVGAPIILENSGIWHSQMVSPLTLVDPQMLPSYFGIFLARNRNAYRDDIINNKSSMLDFHLFEKPKNHATIAAPGTTIFSHHMISLKRDNLFTKDEMRKCPETARSWGMWWYVGIDPSGQVSALPMRMQHYQKLPHGDGVHHSRFTIPPGLYELGPEKGKPHDFVRLAFNASVAFAGVGVSGIQVTIKKDKKAARIGVPITSLRNFFSDRDPNDNGRRKPIIHFRHGHDRHMKDGRIVAVGEHLSGERVFSWRGYDITIGIPGIHYAAPEGFSDPLYMADDPDAPLPPDLDPDDMIGPKGIGNEMQAQIWKKRRVPIRKGQPTLRFHDDHLPHSDPKAT